MNPTALTASVLSNAALGVGVGWTMAWLLNKMALHNDLLWGVAIIPLLAVGLFIAVVASVHPVITLVVFFGATVAAAIVTFHFT